MTSELGDLDTPSQASESRIYPNRLLRSKGSIHADGESYTLTNAGGELAEIVLDYGRAEGGLPVFAISKASGTEPIEFRVIYSETCDGIDSETGDGPYFLFSNAMDTYRSIVHTVQPSTRPQIITPRHAQRSQRYQKLVLISQNSSLSFSSIGFIRIRPEASMQGSFRCSNEKLNRIWLDGARTVDMCSVAKGETAKAWDVTESGTRVYGQHWAPCRHGTRWTDKTVKFQVKIEHGGASWGVHMVANGLIFCLNVEERILTAFEGLSDKSAVFPTTPRGSWEVPDLAGDLSTWISVETIACGSTVTVAINSHQLATVTNVQIQPILGGAGPNSGSVAFGGPCGWTAMYKSLMVTDKMGHLLYKNDLLPPDEARTLADFAVGTNPLSCTIDGAKRDRAVFGGDLHAMGRSIFYSTMNLEAVAGSIKLLTSHQTREGYLGNLCPIQAPLHDDENEPPTYAFYSLGYSLLLVVAIKDYWLHSGDSALVASIWSRLEKLMHFAQNFMNDQGIISAPPPLSMTWFPMGGPVFGASGHINLAFYDALRSMAAMRHITNATYDYTRSADSLKDSIVSHLWNSTTGILKMSDQSPADGLCQDVNAYSISLGVSPVHHEDSRILSCREGELPTAFERLERWDKLQVVSPYATGFAVEACFERNLGHSAVDLLECVWGLMADLTCPNYSGGHWESMTKDGKPYHKDTSLIHGWSTWPVHLLPRYLAGVFPVEPGWKAWAVKPVLAGLDSVDVSLETVAGLIEVSLAVQEHSGVGKISVRVPSGTKAEVFAPNGWCISDNLSSITIDGSGQMVQIELQRSTSSAEIEKGNSPIQTIDEVDAKETGALVISPAKNTWFPIRFDTLRSAWQWLIKVLRIVH